MSLILDALRKLDRDRAAGNVGHRDLSAEILKAGELPGRRGILPVVIALGGAACVAALLLIGGYGPRSGDAPAVSPVSSIQARQTVPAPQPSAPAAAATPAPPPAAVSAVPSESDARTKQPGMAAGDSRPATTKGRVSAKREVDTQRPPRSGEATASRPDVKISGIVWQEESSESKAMINGRVAREGETVDGMKILEIHPTRVRLSYDGKSFNVGMFE